MVSIKLFLFPLVWSIVLTASIFCYILLKIQISAILVARKARIIVHPCFEKEQEEETKRFPAFEKETMRRRKTFLLQLFV